ncbi:DUF6236 family protein [Sphingomonas tabacisoli]|uniref:DUF6236 family protein n=1 Tax=Sphingomonas tabacisoli TaxID=2249466 RepID=A0ABW4I2D3_9SPHN
MRSGKVGFGWLKPGVPVALPIPGVLDNSVPTTAPDEGFISHFPAANEMATDLTFVARPAGEPLGENERGLLFTMPAWVDPNVGGILMNSDHFDETEVRAALLFWDRLEVPRTPLNDYINDTIHNLAKMGVVQRTSVRLVRGAGVIEGQCLLQGTETAFDALEARDPGRWAMGVGSNSLKVMGDARMAPDRGALVRLHNVLPVPDGSVPVEQVLEFKQKRRDELLALRHELDKIYQRIDAAPDRALAEAVEGDALDRAATAALKTALEFHLPVRLSDWAIKLNLNIGEAITKASLAGAASHFVMPELTAIVAGLAGAASFLTVEGGIGLKRRPSAGPFEYVVHYHKELFGK